MEKMWEGKIGSVEKEKEDASDRGRRDLRGEAVEEKEEDKKERTVEERRGRRAGKGEQE